MRVYKEANGDSSVGEYISLFIACLFFHYRSSATRIAECYNQAIAPAASQTETHTTLKTTLDYETVFDAFFLYSLLLDHQSRKRYTETCAPFRLPHGGEQDNRYDEALEERNLRFTLNDRKAWSHACDDCMKIRTHPDGRKSEYPLF